MTVGMYAGTFDPVTNGHLDIVRRAAPLFDEVIVAVADSESALFSTVERTRLFAEATADIANVRVISYDVLTVDVAQREGASVLVRGLRAITDFEYELDMALMNRKMAPALESVFFMTSVEYLFVEREPHPRAGAVRPRRERPRAAIDGGGAAREVPRPLSVDERATRKGKEAVMDLLYLVDRLEELAAGAQRMPIGGRAIIDRRRLLDLVDQMRIAIPQEVSEAREIVERRDELVSEGEEQSRMIVTRAEECAERMVQEHEIAAAARGRAQEVAQQANERLEERIAEANADIQARLADSRRLAQQQMAEADHYAEELLLRLERQLQAFVRTVRAGLVQLDGGSSSTEAEAAVAAAMPGAEPPPAEPAAPEPVAPEPVAVGAALAANGERASEPIPIRGGGADAVPLDAVAEELENLLARPPRPTTIADPAPAPAGAGVLDDLSQPRLDDEPSRANGN